MKEFLLAILKYVFKPCEYIIYSKKLFFLIENRHYKEIFPMHKTSLLKDTHVRSREWQEAKGLPGHLSFRCYPRDSITALKILPLLMGFYEASALRSVWPREKTGWNLRHDGRGKYATLHLVEVDSETGHLLQYFIIFSITPEFFPQSSTCPPFLSLCVPHLYILSSHLKLSCYWVLYFCFRISFNFFKRNFWLYFQLPSFVL